MNPSHALEQKTHKLKRLVQSPNSYFMDVKCPVSFSSASSQAGALPPRAEPPPRQESPVSLDTLPPFRKRQNSTNQPNRPASQSPPAKLPYFQDRRSRKVCRRRPIYSPSIPGQEREGELASTAAAFSLLYPPFLPYFSRPQQTRSTFGKYGINYITSTTLNAQQRAPLHPETVSGT